MPSLAWAPIAKFNLPAGDFNAPWVAALEDFGSFTLLRLEAEGEWSAITGMRSCGPNGLPGTTWSDDRLLLGDCPVGALIGRIGGSTASLKSAGVDLTTGDSKPFPVGSLAVIRIPDKAIGPLFLGFNIVLRPVQTQSLIVTISGAARG